MQEPVRAAVEVEVESETLVAASREAYEPPAPAETVPPPASVIERVEAARPQAVEAFTAPAAPIEPAREAPPREASMPSVEDLESALKETGLVMIETQAGKAQTADTVAEAEVATPRPPRERRPPPADLNEPLQQVETRKEEDQPSA